MNMFNISPAELEQTVMGASPSRLVVIAYNTAIGCLESAIEMIEKGDIEGRWRSVEKATDLISELYMTLDHEQGGEIAQNLGCLYGFVLSRLPRINFYNDVQTAADAIAILEQLRDSWVEVDRLMVANSDTPASAESAGAEAVAV